MRAADRIAAVGAEIDQVRTELRMLDERLAQQREAAEDAVLRAQLAETPLADGQARAARDGLDLIDRRREAILVRLAALEAERHRLAAAGATSR